jgi:hypothetical protein
MKITRLALIARRVNASLPMSPELSAAGTAAREVKLSFWQLLGWGVCLSFGFGFSSSLSERILITSIVTDIVFSLIGSRPSSIGALHRVRGDRDLLSLAIRFQERQCLWTWMGSPPL